VFTIPNNDVAADPSQSMWMDTDIAILVAGIGGTGVISGCAVSAQGTPNMTVAVASGTVQAAFGGGAVAVSSGNLTVTAANSSNPRLDLVSASSNGTKTYTAGVAAATPALPALPGGHIGLAALFVPASATSITSPRIVDKRVLVQGPTASKFQVEIDNGSSTILTGVAGEFEVPWNCTIVSWDLLANTTGSVQFDLWKDTYANYPPTLADSITASAKPALTSATKAQSSTLTGWTTALNAGDVIRINVDSVTGISRVVLVLNVTRS
jgi:hypothetical protein